MKKTLKKLTNVTLATTLSVGPTLTPLMTHAEELDFPTAEEQTQTILDGPTLENEQLLNELEQENDDFLEEENLMDPLEELPANESEEQLFVEKEASKETSLSQTEVESVHSETSEVMELNIDSFILDDWTYTETQDSITLTAYLGLETSIYIPGKFQGKQIILKDLKIFPSNMTHLQLEAIDDQKVGLGTTSLRQAFYNNSKVISLDLSGLDTSEVIDMRSVFQSATNLTTLDVSDWDTSNVTNMSNMFFETSVTSLDLNHFNTSKVTDMRWMFQRAYKLTTLDISNWDTSNVTNMSQMFAYTPKLTTLDLSEWDTSNVVSMQGMFEWASALTSLDLSKWDTSKVTTMYYMFYNASGLTTLDVSGWDTSNVVSMYGMFEKASKLTSLDLSKWDVSKAWGMERMFRDMDNLRILNLGEFKRPQALSGLFYTDTIQPLVIMTTNDELKAYDFVSDNRTGVQFRFETNGGRFSDGTTELVSPEFLVIESQEEVEQLLKNVETPSKEGYQFAEWELTTPLSDNELEALYQRMSGTYQAKWRLPNVAPVIEAEDVTIYEGDSFNALDYASATDDEDGPITLTEDNIVFNNVNPSTPGIYQVTYKVTDQEGATSSKTITVTVLKKEVVELPETDSSTDDTNNDVEKPTPPTTEKPNEPSIEKPTDKPTEKPSTPTTDHQQPNGTNQETIETGFTNFAMLFVGLFACLQGLMVWKHKK